MNSCEDFLKLKIVTDTKITSERTYTWSFGDSKLPASSGTTNMKHCQSIWKKSFGRIQLGIVGGFNKFTQILLFSLLRNFERCFIKYNWDRRVYMKVPSEPFVLVYYCIISHKFFSTYREIILIVQNKILSFGWKCPFFGPVNLNKWFL